MLVISTTVPLVTTKYVTSTWWVFHDKTIVTVCVCTMTMLPLSLYRNMSFLEKWSLLSLCSVVIMCGAVTYTFFKEENISAYATDNTTWLLYEIHDQWAPSIGVVAFAFGCQQYSFFVFQTLENPTRRRWWYVAYFGTCVALLVSLTLSSFGYLRYGMDSMPNILDNLNNDALLTNVTRIVLALTMCLTFPLDFFVVRYTVQRCMQRCCRDEWDDDDAMPTRNGNTLVFSPVFTRRNIRGRGHASDLTTCSHVWFTIVVWCVCMGVCVLVLHSGGQNGSGLGLVLQLTGSIGTIFTAFVFPTATFLRLGTNDYLRPEETWCCWCCSPNVYRMFRYLFAWCVLIFGLSSGCIGAFVSIQNAINSNGNGRNVTTTPSSS